MCVRGGGGGVNTVLYIRHALVALLSLSSWCLVMVERLFLGVPRGCLQFVIVVFPDHTHLLFFSMRDKLHPIFCEQKLFLEKSLDNTVMAY